MEEKNSEKKERKMRDSGIPWIGEVPEGWEFSKIKYHCTMKSGDNITALDISDNGEYPVYGGNGLRGFYKIYNKNGNHILIGRQGALAGNVHLANGKFWATDHAVVVTLKNDVFINYFFRMLESMNLNQYAFDTAAQPGLSVSRIMNLNIVLPNLDEQHRIADFLDSKCSEIDTLIENLRARMESAKEYKKAVITEAVTKGLDKDAKMKDSGVEWIVEIPEGWSFPKITHILDYTHPYPIGDGDHGSIKATDYTEYGIPFIRVQNLGFATDLCLDNVVYISEAQNRTIQNSTLKPNDILFAKTGATIGKVGIVPESIKKANTTSHVGKITVSESIVPKYIFYVLSSNIGYRQFWDIAAQKSTRPELSIDEIKTIRVLLPKTKEEQQQIADYLDSKCSEIDALLQNYEDQITTLEEYKKSLIYEYVTGKKEVPAA